MRIFTAVRHSIDRSQYYGGLWSANFYPALRELGHQIVESQVDLLPASRFMDVPGDFTKEELEARSRVTEQILDEVRTSHRESPLHLFLSYFYNAHFDPAGFDELRRLGIPSVNFYCNSIHQFELVAAVAASADFAWHAERDARRSYLAVGAKPVWVQMAADPNVYHPRAGIPRAPKACFVGQRYADRDRWMAALIRADLPLDIYGPGWGEAPADPRNRLVSKVSSPLVYLGRARSAPGSWKSYVAAMRETIRREGYWRGLRRLVSQLEYRRGTRALNSLFEPHARGAVPFEEISSVFARYEICLNFSNVWADGRPGSKLLPHVRLRDFEAPMCRTCYISGHTDEIAEFYELGREIETYQSEEELVDKMRFYLANSDAAERLREAGYRRAIRDHTWTQRFRQLFREIQAGPAIV
jgi:spore maturation protein CgeB